MSGFEHVEDATALSTGLFLKRNRGRSMAAAILLATASVSADPLVYRGDHAYVVPDAMADKMIELAPRESWQFFPELRRYVDSDDDGALDFVAVALGAEGGFGAQIRYRLSEADESGEQAPGNWYWCVITDETGEKIFEQFNP